MLSVQTTDGVTFMLRVGLTMLSLLLISGCKTSNSRAKLIGGIPTTQINPAKLSPYVVLRWTRPGGRRGLGSGVLLKGNQVLTNAHVIEELKERIGPVDIMSGHESILMPERVKGFESVIPDQYNHSDDPDRSTRYDYGLFKVLGEDVLNPAVPLEYAEFAMGPIGVGELIFYIGYGLDEDKKVGNRRIATTMVDAFIGETHLIATGLPTAALTNGRRFKCIDALCDEVDPDYVIDDPVKIQAGDSGGAGLDEDGRLVAIMAVYGSGLNVSVNLLDSEVIAWLAPKLQPFGYAFPTSGYDANNKPRWPFQRRRRDPEPGDKIELHPSSIVFLDSDAQPIDHLEYPSREVVAELVAQLLVSMRKPTGAGAAAAGAATAGDSPDASDNSSAASRDGESGNAGGDDRRGSRSR